MALSSASTAFALAPSTPVHSPVPAALATRSDAAPQISSASLHGTSTFQAVGAGVALGLGGALAKKAMRPRVAARAAFNPTESTGVIYPLGFWDPCGLMKEREGRDGWRWKDEATFEKYRVAELKHGRLAMLALTGLMSAAVAKFPIFSGSEYKHIDGWSVKDTPAAAGIGLFFIIAAYFELTKPKGDFKDPYGVGAYEGWGYTKDLFNKEIAHGRLAMSAVLTLWLYDYGGISPSGLLPGGNGGVSGYAVAGLLGLFLIWSNNPDEQAQGKLSASKVAESLPAPEAAESK